MKSKEFDALLQYVVNAKLTAMQRAELISHLKEVMFQ
jgi:hypothetical protein